MKKFFFALVILTAIASAFLLAMQLGAPAAVHAQQNEETGIFGKVCDGPGGPGGDCDFNDLIKLVKNVLTFLILVSIPLATIVIAYGGFLLLTANGSEGNISKAKELIFNVLKGFALVLTAWLIVYTIVDVLLEDNSYENFLESRIEQNLV